MSKKKFKATYIAVTTIAFLLLIFPGYAIANRVEPFVLGLPFSFFWIILWIFITFAVVLYLFNIDPDKNEQGGE